MEVKFTKPLSFIKAPIMCGYVELQNGAYVFTSGSFKQVLKKSEYEQIVSQQQPSSEPSVAEESHEPELNDDEKPKTKGRCKSRG